MHMITEPEFLEKSSQEGQALHHHPNCHKTFWIHTTFATLMTLAEEAIL